MHPWSEHRRRLDAAGPTSLPAQKRLPIIESDFGSIVRTQVLVNEGTSQPCEEVGPQTPSTPRPANFSARSPAERKQ